MCWLFMFGEFRFALLDLLLCCLFCLVMWGLWGLYSIKFAVLFCLCGHFNGFSLIDCLLRGVWCCLWC